MTTDLTKYLPYSEIRTQITQALEEDIGTGDISAVLIDPKGIANANIICRDFAVLAGQAWVEETCRQVDPLIQLLWKYCDGDQIQAGDVIAHLHGPARALLTAERTALNFLQTLSGVATLTSDYVKLVADTSVKILDTRKTVPGLRKAQKYAVLCGGGHNHRIGLYDAYLLKENHILAAGSITRAVHAARAQHPQFPLEVEVETLAQLQEALELNVTQILLDNFTEDQLKHAVSINQGRAMLEASGGIDATSVRRIAQTGIQAISIGALTKHVRAVDFSMLFTDDEN